MARRRDPRRIGRGPYLQGLRRVEELWGDGFPFDVPAVAQVERLDLDAPITLLAGTTGPASRRSYDALDAVRFTRGFLDAPERFIRAALDDPEGG